MNYASIFTPGTKISVCHKETGKVLLTNRIPQKGSEQYRTFVQNSYLIAKSLSSQGYDIPSTSEYNSNSSGTSTCSLCGGKGWIAGSKTPTYGNSSSHWCEECQRNVGASHSHDRCPSCSGNGYIRKSR